MSTAADIVRGEKMRLNAIVPSVGSNTKPFGSSARAIH
jgi:hypothetical protein